GGTSIRFILRDGAVRIVGLVPNADEQKRIVNIVQGVPGGVRGYDALEMGGAAAPGQTTAPGQAPAPSQTTVPTETPAPAQPTPGQPHWSMEETYYSYDRL